MNNKNMQNKGRVHDAAPLHRYYIMVVNNEAHDHDFSCRYFCNDVKISWITSCLLTTSLIAKI